MQRPESRREQALVVASVIYAELEPGFPMRFWSRLALIAWLLTGLLSAPALAFGMMTCHGGTEQAAMVMDMPMTMQIAHSSMLNTSKDMDHKAVACAVHCLNAGAGFVLSPIEDISAVTAAMVVALFPVTTLDGLVPGPQLEPPISAFV
jgi:hypothetical protein